nr:ribonuclease T2 [Chthonobacter albigriseus]
MIAASQPAAADTPGDFDFFVLSLSWSPSYCEAEGDSDDPECTGSRPYAFTVHGFWPQYERGWPEFCDSDWDRPSRRDVDGVDDLMPSDGLVRHQWRKHGSCSGFSPAEYFEELRRAREAVTIPPALRRLDRYVTVSPTAVEAAFRAANPTIPAAGIAVTCDRRRLREVRICFSRDLEFRSCEEIDRRDCDRSSVVMPPVR